MADETFVLRCVDEFIASGDVRDACPVASQVWVRSDLIPVGAELSQGDISALASAAITLFALAFAFRLIRRQMVK